ncbi:S1C family serine protease [Williamsia phyllosphaerae]|uniref:Serine protease n=1 Tax=Williamsia phyllosphaerae TaxID=885042 RepID=A0ABQ1UF92_9NOCA|nr:trypsin-like peptidase domain-containing protein [Williamsia phyllosphaerae]GGF17725.1 serine protease [Williamsia phyllosphaerae]
MNHEPHHDIHRADGHRPYDPGMPPGGWQQAPPNAYGPPPQPTMPPARRYNPFGMLALAALTVAVAVLTAFGATALHEQAASPTRSQAVAPVQRVDNTVDGTASATLQRAAQAVVPGMVYINTELGYQNGAGAGTGIVLSSTGEVLTNNHVISGATSITATDLGNGRTYPATVVGYDRKSDVAVVKLTGATGLTTAPLGDSSAVKVGDAIVGVGNAGGGGGDPTAAPGRVTALDQAITASDESTGSAEQLTGLIQIAANIQPGDSGGPLVNSSGKVVGMNTAASQGYRLGGQNTGGGEGFAIPIARARTVADQITSGSRSATVHIGDSAMLGVTASDGPNGSGALVQQVLENGSAAQVLSAGDTITSINGTPIGSVTALTEAIDTLYPGDSVPVNWIDANGQQQSATVTLAEGAAA